MDSVWLFSAVFSDHHKLQQPEQQMDALHKAEVSKNMRLEFRLLNQYLGPYICITVNLSCSKTESQSL